MQIDAMKRRLREIHQRRNTLTQSSVRIRKTFLQYNKTKNGGLLSINTCKDFLLLWRTTSRLNKATGLDIKRGERLFPFDHEAAYFEEIDRAMREFDSTFHADHQAFDEVISTYNAQIQLLIFEETTLNRLIAKHETKSPLPPRTLKAAQKLCLDMELDISDFRYSLLS